MKLKIGMRCPFPYGVAWVDICHEQRVCYWVPFNWIARAGRWLWIILAFPPHSEFERQVRVTVSRQINEAHHGTYHAGYEQALNDLKTYQAGEIPRTLVDHNLYMQRKGARPASAL